MRRIYTRDGIYYVRIPTGVPKQYERLSLHTTDKAEAARQAESMLAAHRSGSAANVLWQTLAELFKKEHFGHLKKGTQDTYRWAIVALTHVFYDKPIRQIDNALMDRFVKKRLETDGLSRGGVRAELQVLSVMMGFAVGKGLMLYNPVTPYIKANKRKVRRGEPRVRWLVRTEETQVLVLAEDYAMASVKRIDARDARLTLRRAIIVAIDTGLRVAEIRHLKWAWVSFERQEVHIPKEIAKSGKDRWVPLLPRVLALLKEMKAEARCDWVFPNDTATGPRVNFDKALRQFVAGPVAASGIAPFGWHDLRRTCGCRLLQVHKLSMEEVSKWLGHSSITVTERHYAFLTVDSLHEAVGTKLNNTQAPEGGESKRESGTRNDTDE